MNLKDELAKPDIKREEFFSLYAKLIKERFPFSRVDFHPPDEIEVETPDKRTFTLFLQNLWLQCSNASEPRIDIIERYLAGVGSLMEPEPPVTKDQIVPILKDDGYLTWDKGPSPLVREHFAGDLWIVYALDLPHSTNSLTAEKLDELKIPKDALHALALDNLRRILPEIEQHGDGPWYMLTAGGDYTASLLLLDDLWSQLEDSVDGDIVAAAPSRDVVLFTGSNMREGVRAIRHKAREIHEGGDHVVSQTLLRRTAGKWKVFE